MNLVLAVCFFCQPAACICFQFNFLFVFSGVANNLEFSSAFRILWQKHRHRYWIHLLHSHIETKNFYNTKDLRKCTCDDVDNFQCSWIHNILYIFLIHLCVGIEVFLCYRAHTHWKLSNWTEKNADKDCKRDQLNLQQTQEAKGW